MWAVAGFQSLGYSTSAVSCWLLVHASRYLSQDETKLTVATAEQIHKNFINSALATIICCIL